MLRRASWPFVLVGAAIISAVALRFWAHDIRAYETRALDAMGVPMPVRIIGLTVLFAGYLAVIYVRAKREAAREGVPVIRRSVALFAFGSLSLLAVLIFFAAIK